MAIEYELKYRASAEDLDAMDASFAEAPRVYRMQTTYYDTREGALSARHITLRRRMENETSVCTLKAPADRGRLEFEVECDNIQDALEELCKLSGIADLPALVAKGVEPVCGARFTRTARTVRYGNTTVEIALDRGLLLGGGREQPFWEAEVELKDGNPDDAAAYAARLAGAFGLEAEPKSKFKRALALAKGE